MTHGVISDPSFMNDPRPWVDDGNGPRLATREIVATLLGIIAQCKGMLISPDYTAEQKIECAEDIERAMALCDGFYDGPWPDAMTQEQLRGLARVDVSAGHG